MLVKGATGGTWSSAHISIHVRDICLPAWWRHQMAALLALYADNSLVTGEVSWQRPVTQTFDVFFDLRLNKRLSNNRDAGDLRRHRVHYDFTVMEYSGWCDIRLTFRKFTVLVKIYKMFWWTWTKIPNFAIYLFQWTQRFGAKSSRPCCFF